MTPLDSLIERFQNSFSSEGGSCEAFNADKYLKDVAVLSHATKTASYGNLTICMMKVPSDISNPTTRTALLCLLRLLKNDPSFRNQAALEVQRLIEKYTLTPSNWPGLKELLKTAFDEKIIDPDEMDPQIFYPWIIRALASYHFDPETANRILSLAPQLMHVCHRHSGKSLIHYLIDSYSLHAPRISKTFPHGNQGTDPTPPSSLGGSVTDGRTEILKSLLMREDIDWSATDNKGRTLFYFIAYFRIPLDLTSHFPELSDETARFLIPSGDHSVSIDDFDHFLYEWDRAEGRPSLSLNQATYRFLDIVTTTWTLTDDIGELIHLFFERIHQETNFSSIFAMILKRLSLTCRKFDWFEKVLTHYGHLLRNCPLEGGILNLFFESLKNEGEYDMIADRLLFASGGPFEHSCFGTLLTFAVTRKDKIAVKFILDKSFLHEEDRSIIAIAVSESTPEVVKILLQHPDLDVNEANFEGNTPLHEVALSGSETMLDLLLSREDLDPTRFDCKKRLAAPLACRHRHYNIAKKIYDRFGNQAIAPEFKKVLRFQWDFGVDAVAYDELLDFEAERILHWNYGSFLDIGALYFFSAKYNNFWEVVEMQPLTLDAVLEARKKFPFKNDCTDFIKAQIVLYEEMQKHKKFHGFPIREMWRFAIDADSEERGCFAFESEPGFLKGFFQGFLYVLQNPDQLMTEEGYLKLHHLITSEVCRYPNQWNIAEDTLRKTPQGLRTDGVGFRIPLDHDPIGLHDLETRKGASNYSFDNKAQILSYRGKSLVEETRKRLAAIFTHYQTTRAQLKSRAEILMLSLWACRELELEHAYMDGNGRSSHIEFLGILNKERELPICLFPDPNVFDANGPESLAARYLEGCQNYLNHGKGHAYLSSNHVKTLNSIPLDDPDLLQLREELRPLVTNQPWRQSPILGSGVSL